MTVQELNQERVSNNWQYETAGYKKDTHVLSFREIYLDRIDRLPGRKSTGASGLSELWTGDRCFCYGFSPGVLQHTGGMLDLATGRASLP